MKKFPALLLLMVLFLAFLPAAADDQIPQSQMLDQARHALQGVLNQMDDNLTAAASSLTVLPPNTPDSDKVLDKLSQSLPGMVDCAMINTDGIVTAVKPDDYMRFEGKDISDQAQFSKLRKTLKPVTSRLFSSEEGYESIAFQYPIITPQGNWIGAVSALTDITTFVGSVLEPLNKEGAQKYYFTVMQKDGWIVYDSDPAQIGLNLFKNPIYQKQTELLKAGKDFCQKAAGNAVYTASYQKTNYTVKSMWDTVVLYGTEWRIIVENIIGEKAPIPGK